MKIRIGYELEFHCPKPTPMILTLNVHSTRIADLITPDRVVTDPPIPVEAFFDHHGNQRARIIAPGGKLRITNDTCLHDSGLPDTVNPQARQTAVEQLPNEALQFLSGSRYCETDLLSGIAWQLFDNDPSITGWSRVQAICDYVYQHIEFGYGHARVTRTAWEVWQERQGVCRDFAHLAIAFCRCMNIPARYCTGYLGDMGIPPPHGEMDFAAWFEAYLDGRWYIFDPRNNMPRIGRILVARGRDATDVAISTAFGANTLTAFKIRTDEILETEYSPMLRSAL
ncbi:transglutaminase-like domain-containing protein [Halopseudomonas salegens]|nr:transglutaminase family protein [Halopseudomonas salegens]